MESVVQKTNYLDFLEGCRAIAALWVMCFHIHLLLFGNRAFPWFLSFLSPIRYGHLAVGLFIVISGFCLTIPIAVRRKKIYSVPGFLLRRAIRIVPPLFIALVLGVILQVIYFKLSNGSVKIDRIGIIYSFMLIQDLFPKYYYPAQWLWSVDLELKLYVLFPLFVCVLLKFGKGVLITVGLLSGLMLTVLYWRFLTGFDWELSSPWYVFLFVMGMYACWYCFNSPGKMNNGMIAVLLSFSLFLLCLICLIFPFGTKNFLKVMPITDTLVGILGSALLILLKSEDSFFRRIMQLDLLKNIGKISYSIYLTHVLFIRNFEILFRRHGYIKSDFFAWICCVVGVICFAILFFRFVEKPCLDLLAKMREKERIIQ